MSEERDDDESGDERRRATRHLACFAAHVLRDEGSRPRTALIRDLSVTGASLLTRAKLEIGEPVQLALYLDRDSNEARTVSARVVRSEPLPPEALGLWQRVAAVQFDAPITDVEAQVAAVAEAQARVAGRAK